MAWECVLIGARGLWLTRIPFLSVVIGCVVLLQPAAQDVLAAIAGIRPGGTPLAIAPQIRLSSFAFTVTALWSFPVYFMSCWLLRDSAMPVESSRCPGGVRTVRRFLPFLLGAASLVIVSLACLFTAADLPNLTYNEDFVESIRQALRYQVVWFAIWGVIFVIIARRVQAWQIHERAYRWVFLWYLAVFCSALATLYFSPLSLVSPLEALVHKLCEFGNADCSFYDRYLGSAPDLSRSLALPLILGAWLPLLTWLSDVGRIYRVPLVTCLLVVLILVDGFITSERHDVRVARSIGNTENTEKPTISPAKRPRLDEAVAMWKQANQCSGADCPRPIIVAAAGGAARATFFTTSVIGHFLDVERHRATVDGAKQPTSNDTGRYDPDRVAPNALAVKNRLFAFSGVSGGAVGAVLTVAALRRADRLGADLRHPCQTENVDPLWYGHKLAAENWRDCLEVLASGDYLTPTIFGLAFSDWIPLTSEDRAALLERLWERSFFTATGQDEDKLGTPFLNALPRTAPGPDGRMVVNWLPLLVLNGTSVSTGQRIVTSGFAPLYKPSDKPCPAGWETHGRDVVCPLFKQTLDFHTLIEQTSDGSPADGIRDIPLSTSASNSARFPVISPPGAIRNADDVVIDRIVDGGYVENYGAMSALDIARAIRAVDPKLQPFVLVISNDPGSTVLDNGDPSEVSLPESNPFSIGSDVLGPLGAVIQVRTGRGRQAVADLEAWLDREMPASAPGQPQGNFAHIRVWPEEVDGASPASAEAGWPDYCDARLKFRDVAMSWWLHMTTQLHLRQQVEPGKKRACGKEGNNLAIRAVWEALSKPRPATPTPAPPPQTVPTIPPEQVAAP